MNAPPGWWRDPSGRHEHRFWDGRRWSEWVADAGVTSVEPTARSNAKARLHARLRALPFAMAAAAVLVPVLGALINAAVDDLSRVGDDGEVVEIPVADAGEVTVGAGGAWVVRDGDEDEQGEDAVEAIVRIDPASGEITDEIEIERPRGLAATDDAIWVGALPRDLGDPVVLTRIDPTSHEIVVEVPLPDAPADDTVAAGPAGVWLITGDARLVQVDPATNDVTTATPIDGSSPRLALGEDAVWVSPGGAGESEFQRIDAATGEVTGIDLSTGDDDPATTDLVLGPITAGGGAAWVVRSAYDLASPDVNEELCRVDAGTEEVHCADIGIDPLDQAIESIAHGADAVWVAVRADEDADGASRVLRTDPDSLEVEAEFDVPSDAFLDLAAGEGAAWATSRDGEDTTTVLEIPR